MLRATAILFCSGGLDCFEQVAELYACMVQSFCSMKQSSHILLYALLYLLSPTYIYIIYCD